MNSKRRLWLSYLAGFLMAVHFASVSYINSSLLGKFVSNNTIGLLYIGGSILSILFLLIIPRVLRRYGSVPIFLFFIALEIISVFGLGALSIPVLVVFLFLIHLSGDPTLYLCLDINLEQETKSEGTTGTKRGLSLTFGNIAWILGPLALIFLINKNDFSKVYFLSSLALIPLFIVVAIFFKNTKKADASSSNIFLALKYLGNGGDKSRIIGIQFVLNFFYSWMVIYMPLLLSKDMGFGWDKIGLVFFMMLLPFPIFQLPAGILADRKLGEKEILAFGFSIMIISTSFLAFLNSHVFWIWGLALFATRIGASLVEVASESYFFKHVKEEDTGLISLFRVTRPFSYVISPLIALPIIYFTSYSASFFFLAVLTLSGIFLIPKIDTK
jgi:MFS family permease